MEGRLASAGNRFYRDPEALGEAMPVGKAGARRKQPTPEQVYKMRQSEENPWGAPEEHKTGGTQDAPASVISWRATAVFEEGGVVRSSMVVSSSPGAPKVAGDAMEPPKVAGDAAEDPGPPKAADTAEPTAEPAEVGPPNTDAGVVSAVDGPAKTDAGSLDKPPVLCSSGAPQGFSSLWRIL